MILSGIVKKDNFYVRVKKYKLVCEVVFFNNSIFEEVYDNFVKMINKYLLFLYCYIVLRKKVLEFDEVYIYDLYILFVKDVGMKVMYEEVKDYMLKGLVFLGEEYVFILKEGLENCWVDVYENKGKCNGVYLLGVYGMNLYILMNWYDNVNNFFMFVYEFGYFVYSYYMRKYQLYLYGNYSIFVVEVVFMINEVFFGEYLLNNLDDEKQCLYIFNYMFEGFRGMVFR